MMNRKLIVIFTVALLACITMTALAIEQPQTTIKLDISQDFLTLLKFALRSATIFIVVLAGIGVAFFGFDVRKARGSILDMTSELRNLLAEAKKDHENLKGIQKELIDLKDRFDSTVQKAEERIEKLGAEIESFADKSSPIEIAPLNPHFEKQSPTEIQRSEQDLIREVIKSSSFKWNTIARLIKRTGFEREHLLDILRKMPDIEISMGENSQDYIFRLKGQQSGTRVQNTAP